MAEPKPLRWSFLGRVAYSSATRLQEEIRERLRSRASGDHLLLLEHPHVYTLGRGAERSDVVAADSWLQERGVEIEVCDRGGQVTYHGPGQLVGYPVIDLSPDRRDIRRYVHDLQEVLVRTLVDFGIEARAETRQSLIGVWVGESKIASLGVHVSRWVTTHGFALNVGTDLTYFHGIVPCGLTGVRMASIETQTGNRPSLEIVAERLAGHFGDVFERRLEPVRAAGLLSLADGTGHGREAAAVTTEHRAAEGAPHEQNGESGA